MTRHLGLDLGGSSIKVVVLEHDGERYRETVTKVVPTRTAEPPAGIVTQLGLARRISPSRAAQDAKFAHDLVHELPATMAALTCGALSQWRAVLIARETAHLSTAPRSSSVRSIPVQGMPARRAAGRSRSWSRGRWT